MASGTWQKRAGRLLCVLCGVSFVLSAMLAYNYRQQQLRLLHTARELAERQAQDAAAQIEAQLRPIMSLATAFGHELSAQRLTPDEIKQRLQNIFQENDKIFEVGVAYTPDARAEVPQLFAPHYGIQDNTPQFFHVEQYYDYTKADWYTNAMTDGSHWIEPYFGRATNNLVTGYSVAFTQPLASDKIQTSTGVARINISLKEMKKLVQSLGLGRMGYGFILSRQGTFIVHPTEAYIQNHATIFDLSASSKAPAWQSMGEHALRGSRGGIEHRDAVTGQSSWILYEPIPSTGWTLGVVFLTDELLQSTPTARHHLIWTMLIGLVFLALASVLAVGAHKGGLRRLWTTAITVSFLSACGIGIMWYLTLQTPFLTDSQHVILLDRAGIDKFLATTVKTAAPADGGAAVYVPTGVFVQSIEFSSANNVTLTGYIWQKYARGTHDDLSRGFVLPEAAALDITEAYRRNETTQEVVGWYFKATLRQDFDYMHYPFDQQDVWLRFWHKDFDRNIILTPDLASYKFLNPSLLPGLEQDFVLEGWTLEKSFFSYRTNSYNTNFGIENYIGQDNFPELYFNITLRRNFINPFVSNMIPLFIVAIMTFAVLVITTKHESKVTLHGFNSAAVLTYCAALFFVVILSHIDLRSKLVAREIVYLEYFYIVMYLTLLWVSVNTILFASNSNLRFIQYHDNFIPQLLYWPVIQGLLFVITVISFY